MEVKEEIDWKAEWTIYKWDKNQDQIAVFLQNGGSVKEAAKIFEAVPIVESFVDNVALNEGLGELIDIICGLGTPTKWDNANARLGVGDSNAAEGATQTGLQATTNKTFKAMDTGYPQRSGQTAEWRSTFGGTDANFAWNEFTVVNAADDSGKNLNRKVENKGTKASGEILYIV